MTAPARTERLRSLLLSRWRTLAAYGALIFTVFALWNNILLVPFRILTVFVHELSHAAAALATGGTVAAIQIAPDGSGLCTAVGGNAFAILSAGYLGSMLWGAILLIAAERMQGPGRVLLGIAALMVTVAIIWVRPMAGFGFGFCLIAAAALVWAALEGPRGLHTALLRLLGLTSCLYALADIRRELFSSRAAASDASLMADLTGLPAWFWAMAWLALAFLIATAFLRGMIAPAPPGKLKPLPLTGKDRVNVRGEN